MLAILCFSSKKITAQVLNTHCESLKTDGNFNSVFGLRHRLALESSDPKTEPTDLFGLRSDADSSRIIMPSWQFILREPTRPAKNQQTRSSGVEPIQMGWDVKPNTLLVYCLYYPKYKLHLEFKIWIAYIFQNMDKVSTEMPTPTLIF